MRAGEKTNYKVCLVGNVRAGKTQLLNRKCNKQFQEEYAATSGADFGLINLDFVKLTLWDLSGQNDFRGIIRSYLNDCSDVLLCFDMTSNDISGQLNSWVDWIIAGRGRGQGQAPSPKPLHITLVPAKFDLVAGSHQQQHITYLNRLKNEHPDVIFSLAQPTSAKTGVGVDEVFGDLIARAAKKSAAAATESGTGQELRTGYGTLGARSSSNYSASPTTPTFFQRPVPVGATTGAMFGFGGSCLTIGTLALLGICITLPHVGLVICAAILTATLASSIVGMGVGYAINSQTAPAEPFRL